MVSVKEHNAKFRVDANACGWLDDMMEECPSATAPVIACAAPERFHNWHSRFLVGQSPPSTITEFLWSGFRFWLYFRIRWTARHTARTHDTVPLMYTGFFSSRFVRSSVSPKSERCCALARLRTSKLDAFSEMVRETKQSCMGKRTKPVVQNFKSNNNQEVPIPTTMTMSLTRPHVCTALLYYDVLRDSSQLELQRNNTSQTTRIFFGCVVQ